jgi:hypothetical protein
VTITGSGFAVGKSATGFRFGLRLEEEEFGAAEAVEVNCTTTTECTATTPEVSEELFEERISTVDVTAIVNGVTSPATPEDHFHYHGLYLVGNRGRLPIGEGVGLKGYVFGEETTECAAIVGGRIASNGEITDELDISPGQFVSCNQRQFFGDLPFSVALRLSYDGSATIEGPMGVRNDSGCVYEGNQLAGSWELNEPLKTTLVGHFTLVAEEEPGAECAETELVELTVGTQAAFPVLRRFG